MIFLCLRYNFFFCAEIRNHSFDKYICKALTAYYHNFVCPSACSSFVNESIKKIFASIYCVKWFWLGEIKKLRYTTKEIFIEIYSQKFIVFHWNIISNYSFHYFVNLSFTLFIVRSIAIIERYGFGKDFFLQYNDVLFNHANIDFCLTKTL